VSPGPSQVALALESDLDKSVVTFEYTPFLRLARRPRASSLFDSKPNTAVFASKRTESAGSSSSRRLHWTLNWRERTRARRSPSHRTRLASREVVTRHLRSWRGGRPALRAPCRSEGQRMVTCIAASGAAARESASLRRSCGHEAHGGAARGCLHGGSGDRFRAVPSRACPATSREVGSPHDLAPLRRNELARLAPGARGREAHPRHARRVHSRSLCSLRPVGVVDEAREVEGPARPRRPPPLVSSRWSAVSCGESSAPRGTDGQGTMRGCSTASP
jgi:hypothetical protein